MDDSEGIEYALKIAERSGLAKYKTGCAIFKHGKLVSNGWSHYSNLRLSEYWTVHAELHAIYRANKADLIGASLYVATYAAKSRNIVLSKPCDICLPYLQDVGFDEVIYSEKLGESSRLNFLHVP